MQQVGTLQPGSTRAILAALTRAHPGAFFGIARSLPDAGLTLVESPGSPAPAALRLGPLLAEGRPVWTQTAGQRLASGWSLALGCRPTWLCTARVPGCEWILVCALPPSPDAAPPGTHGVEQALAALAESFAAGALTVGEQREAALLQTLVHSLSTPVAFIGDVGGEVLLNAAARELLDLAQHRPSQAEVIAALRELAAAGESAPGDAPVEIRWHERVLLVSRQRIAHPQASGLLWQFLDVTLIRAHERSLMEDARARTLATLAGGIAHEFNNLLTVVIGEAESLADQPSLDALARRSLQNLINAAERGAGLVGQLRSYAAPAGAVGELIDLACEVRRLEPFLRQQLPPAERLHIRIEHAPLEVSCDRGGLADALFHLLANARQATREGGEVSLSASRDARARVILQVSDSGIGMDPDTLRRCREPFFTSQGRAEARGLGLPIVAGFARRHGGQLLIESQPGSGTTVSVILPAAGSAASALRQNGGGAAAG